MKAFKRVLALLWPHKKYIGLNFVFNLIQIIAGLFTITLVMPFLDIMFNGGDKIQVSDHSNSAFNQFYSDFMVWFTQMVQSDKPKALVLVSVTIIIASVVKNVSRYFALYFLVILRLKSVKVIREKIYSKLLRLPISYFTNEKKGDIISRMSNDIKEVEWSMNSSLEALYKEPLMILFYLGALFFINAKLTIFVLVMLPVAIGSIALLGKSIRRKSKRNNEGQANLMSFLEETLGGMKSIKAFVVESHFYQRFVALNNNSTTLNMKVNQRGDMASPISEILGTIVAATILWYGGNMVLKGEMFASVYIGYFGIFSQLIPPFKVLSQAYPMLQRGSASLDRFDEILNADEKVIETTNAKEIKQLNHQIEFKNVSFSYGNKPVLNGINFRIKKGEKVALVGSSGSGKSTIGDLIPRFHDIHAGELLIDGISIKDYKISELRNLIGIVSQEPILFNDSIKNNILFGSINYSDEQVFHAAKLANAYDFIMQMENGFDTMIGERGGKLSGGQKQRIVIARALLKNPEILILDEATSALDNESEKVVQSALDSVGKGRTTIVIAHRLSTIIDSDQIIVLENGIIVEQGSHQELINKKGAYYKLTQISGSLS